MSSDESKRERDFEEAVHPAFFAGAAVASLTIPFVGPAMSVMFAQGAINSASIRRKKKKESWNNKISGENKELNAELEKKESKINMFFQEHEVSLKNFELALNSLKNENNEKYINFLEIAPNKYKRKNIWYLINKHYENAKFFSLREINWFLVSLTEKINFQKIAFIEKIIIEILLDSYFPQCLEYKKDKFGEIGLSFDDIKKIDSYIKKFLLKKFNYDFIELGNWKQINKEFSLQLFKTLKQLHPLIAVQSYLEKDFFSEEKFLLILCEFNKSIHNQYNSFEEINFKKQCQLIIDKHLHNEQILFRKKYHQNSAPDKKIFEKNFENNNIPTQEQNRNLLIKEIEAFMQENKSINYPHKLYKLYEELQKIDDLIILEYSINNKNNLENFKQKRKEFNLKYENYLIEIGKLKKTNIHENKKLKSSPKLNNKKFTSNDLKIIKQFSETFENINQDIKDDIEKYKEIENLLKIKIFNNNLSKKIALKIEEVHEDEYIFDEVYSLIYGYIFYTHTSDFMSLFFETDSSGNVINKIDENGKFIIDTDKKRRIRFVVENTYEKEIKENINLKNIDNFFEYKSIVIKKYHLWIRELIEYNKNKKNELQVSHNIYYAKDKD